MKTGTASLLGLIVCLTFVDGSYAQSQPTIWSFMGIPQAGKKIHGTMFNRRGNHPGLEKKPALKSIADPANLESPVPAIKKAAEVKMAEDLKKQKIKAVKYLAEIGCGCYDIDGSITEAMLASSEDCTEDVRLATVRAIAEQAGGSCCENCGEVCCCNEAVLKRLAQMAYHRDDKGCYIEPSERVREEAARALELCCPSQEPVIEIGDETGPQPLPPELPEGIETQRQDDSIVPEGAETAFLSARTGVAPVPAHDSVNFAPVTSPHGVIIHTDKRRRAAHVHFVDQESTIPVGAVVLAYVQTAQGREVVGRMRVYQAFQGSANLQELDSGTFDKLVLGTRVMADPKLVALGNPRF